MDAAPPTVYPALSTWERASALTAVALCAAAILAGPARWILAPTDPQGCVSVLSCRLGWLAIPLCALLAFVLAALVAWLTGGKLDELGVLAVGTGLALAALPHENSSVLWLEIGQGSDKARAALAMVLTLETAAWLAVLAAAWLGGLVASRRGAAGDALNAHQEVPRGVLTVLAMTAIAAVLIPVFSTGTELAPVDTGQVYFCVAASFYLGSLIAYQLTGAHSIVWAYCSVILVTLGGCVYTIFNPTPEFPGRQIGHFMQLPPTDYVRALPIQAVAAGVAAAILGNWQQRQMTTYAVQEARTTERL